MKPIEVFVRITPHDGGRDNNKKRPNWFSKENCYKNMLKTVNKDLANVTYFFDGNIEDHKEHFLYKEKNTVKIVSANVGGSDAATFYSLMQYISSLSLKEETIVYMVEDDYIHRNNWCEIMQDGFEQNPSGYVTLYDHPDKYWKFVYPDLTAKIACGKHCYWRTIPSTTSTYATTFKVFKEDFNESIKFCDIPNKSNWDHKRFVYLTSVKKRNITSCMPGWSTHCMSEYLAPYNNWQKYA
jgi:hypothetical protein